MGTGSGGIIFLGETDRINWIYSEDIQNALERESCVKPILVKGRDEFSKMKGVLSNAEIIFSTWGIPDLSKEEIDSFLPNLKAVFYAAGSVQYFARPFLQNGVRVFSAWAANGVPVAEFTLAQILLANKKFFSFRIKSKEAYAKASSEKRLIAGNYKSKVGILGAGAIGRKVISYLKMHDLHVLAFDPFVSESRMAQLGAQKASLEEIFSTCLAVSNHMANNPQTVGILNYDLFSRMIPQASFINTGRGAQVSEPDLVRILKERPDLTALLDVSWPEPPEAGNPLYSLDNCVITPHIAGSVGREPERMALYMLEEYKRYKNRESCLYELTPDMLETMA
ncbi:MAG: hydroxyacid dehydrogenase [Clostridiales bacterium]|jgi:phosphoglycerate dehydrogenase-like enzyme|nr:hydroxyacid dehydrogenase [Clostridiales bacterium]